MRSQALEEGKIFSCYLVPALRIYAPTAWMPLNVNDVGTPFVNIILDSSLQPAPRQGGAELSGVPSWCAGYHSAGRVRVPLSGVHPLSGVRCKPDVHGRSIYRDYSRTQSGVYPFATQPAAYVSHRLPS